MKHFFSCCLIFLFISLSYSQTSVFYNNGATVYIASNCIVQVNGRMIQDSTSYFENHGIVTVSNSISPGDFMILNNSTVTGDGKIYLENDWVNSANFITDLINNRSYVNMFGSNQLITGDSVSTFYDLELTGSGIKTQTLDAAVLDTLALNNVELATSNFYMLFLNPDTGAITRNNILNGGFVSSTNNGRLVRVTNSSNNYLFPTGSSNGTTRYRPVKIKPSSSNTNFFAISLVNNDATIDGYDISKKDSSICIVNNLFYHNIDRISGTDNADIKIFYDPLSDGYFDAMLQWNTPTLNLWNTISTSNFYNSSPLSYIGVNNWSDFSNSPFALGQNKPIAPTITGDSLLCLGENAQLSLLNADSNNTYIWIDSNGDTIAQGIGINNVNYTVSSQSTINVITQSSGGCVSLPSSFNISLLSSPDAGFITDTNGVFSGQAILFNDTSSGNPITWTWYFGEGDSSNLSSPYHIYDKPGTYDVTLIVSNQTGCVDTAYGTVTINEGVIIPNVFSPNGDGKNDLFEIKNSGLEEFNLKIYNRWGTLIYETNQSNAFWDGRTLAGKEAPEGTYYFILKARSKSKDYSTTGHITLLK